MKHNTTVFSRALVILVLIVSLLLPGMANARAAGNTWAPAENTQIFWVRTADSSMEDVALVQQIQLFDSELAAKVTTEVLPIVYGNPEDSGDSDILLKLDSTLGIAREGYEIAVDGGCVVVSASDRDGLFYGCRNLIQQLLTDGAVAECSDQPDVAERAVSLDNGRKYYSVAWIKEFIREMSWSNMNTLVLHFSEEMGLGIESKRYPWLAGRDGTLCTQAEVATDNTSLTQEEIAEIVAYAKLYHVEIIPSFDSPGHMNYVVKKFNEQCADQDYAFTYGGKTYTAAAGSEIGNYFHYNGKTSIVKGSRNASYSRGIDISNEVAVAFTKSLIEEYATLFHDLGCTKFDIGGDELLGWGSAVVSTSTAPRWQQLDHWKEYAIAQTGNQNAVAYDAFLLYMNDLYSLVTGLGYTNVRMWNDDALRSSDTGWKGVVQLDQNIDIWYWSAGSNTVWTYLDAGYEVYNILSGYNYYAMTGNYFSDNRTSFTKAYPDKIYTEWNPYVFDPDDSTLNTEKNTEQGNSGVLGSAFGVWCDNPSLKTQEEVMEDLIPLIRAHAVKAWDSQRSYHVSYDDYCAQISKLGNAPADLPAAPDVVEVTKLDLTAYHEAIAAFDATDASAYTSDSYGAYADAVDAAKALVGSEACTQAMLDDAVSNIVKKANDLVAIGTEAPALTLQTASIRVLNGKYVTLTAYLHAGAQGIEICDAQGNTVPITAFSAGEDAGSGIHSVTVQFVVTGSGICTYQVFTLDADGNRFAEPVSLGVIG